MAKTKTQGGEKMITKTTKPKGGGGGTGGGGGKRTGTAKAASRR